MSIGDLGLSQADVAVGPIPGILLAHFGSDKGLNRVTDVLRST
jgi:hypothetical protein